MYLSSFRVGDHPDRLLALMRRPGPAVVIANSCDTAPPERRAAEVQRELDALGSLGIEASRARPARLRRRPRPGSPTTWPRCELVWARGGNTFLLRHALAVSGGDEVLTDLLAKDAIVYGGYSAGGCVLAPSLRGLEAVRRAGRRDGDLRRARTVRRPGPAGPAVRAAPRLARPPRDRASGEGGRALPGRGRRLSRAADGQVLVVDGDLVELSDAFSRVSRESGASGPAAAHRTTAPVAFGEGVWLCVAQR